jgi:hypothetical protein
MFTKDVSTSREMANVLMFDKTSPSLGYCFEDTPLTPLSIGYAFFEPMFSRTPTVS